MNRKTTRTNMNRKFFAMLLIVSLVLSLCAVGFSASADTGAVSPSDAVASDTVAATDTINTDTVSAADTPVVSESEPIMMFAAAPAPDDIASGTIGTCSWIIDANGVLTIYPTDGASGSIGYVGEGSNMWPWYSNRTKIKKVVVENGVSSGESCFYMFYGMSGCTEIDLRGFDTSAAKNMGNMFEDNGMTTVIFGDGFDTSNVTNMSRMFYSCDNLTAVDASSFDTSSVTNMKDMFCGCKALTDVDVSGFDTSKVTNMYGMFSNCQKLTQLDVSGFDTSNVTDMGHVFSACYELESVGDVGGWDTSKVTNMNSMFGGCSALTSLNVTDWVTSNVTNMHAMFTSCRNLAVLDVSGFDTAKVTDMGSMFSGCYILTPIDVSGFKTSNVTDMDSMFSSCRAVQKLDVTGFDTAKVTDMSSMFSSCSKLTDLDVSGFDTSKVTDMSNMFYYCTSLPIIDVANFNTSNVTDMRAMFGYCKKVTSLDVTDFDTSKVTDMSNMFGTCSSLTELDVSNFNTSNVTNMCRMFESCSSLTELDVSSFDSSKVTDMSYMFSTCSKLASIDVSGLETGNVTNMRTMFGYNHALTELDLSSFDTSKVTNMSNMFSNCGKLTSVDISGLETGNVTDMTNLFDADYSLNQYTISADWKPAAGYEAKVNINFVNVENGKLIYTPQTSFAVKSLTIDGEDVEFDVLGGEYDGFTGDNVAVITFAPAMTVAFMDGETEVDNQTVAQGGDAKDPYADVSKIIGMIGKHFAGWDKIIKNIQQNLIVNALYEFNDYVLAFDANGGEGDMAPVAFKYDTAQEIPENTFTKEGYTFIGWNTAADLSGDSYDDKATVKNLTDEHNVTVTFYAQWLINTYSVSFMDSADDSLIEDVPVEYGESVTAPTVSNVVGWATEKNGTTKADLSKVTGNMTVWAIYRDEYTGAPSVVFDKESKTFDIDEEIKFKAVGYWADSSTTDFLDGDERYVPTNWHHAEPSGDFGGKTAPTDTYSASFKQSAAGTYTLKVEFAKSVYQSGAWVDDGIVTVETEYKVVAPSAGDTDVPKTGDSSGNMILITNIMLICVAGMYFTWRMLKKKENA